MGDDSAASAEYLEALARKRFGDNLSEAEKRLLRAIPTAPPETNFVRGGPNFDDKDPENDPAMADNWGSEREIRAVLIRWLCVDQEASKTVDLRGLNVYAARITGELDLSFATVTFPLLLYRCRLADGVALKYVRIPGLSLRGSSIGSLDLEGADVRGDVVLNSGFSAAGKVRLSVAQIGGNLSCKNGTFKNPGGDALTADQADVKGIVFLNTGFSADGTVRLAGAQMGFLECDSGKFSSLILYKARVKGNLGWHDVKSITQLDLRDASVGAVRDDEASWPVRGNLLLDGFVYERIASGPTDARTRLDWLDRQPKFKPQPYRQLAKILRERGDDDGAREVLFELENRAKAEDRAHLLHSPLRWLLRSGEDAVSEATVGYGIYPGRALWYLCGLTALGWIVHRRAQRIGVMAPTDKDAYAEFHDGKTPARSQPFNPLIYCVENCLPLVKLGQDERWQPDPNPQRRVPEAAKGKFRRLVDSALDFPVRDWAVTPAALRWFRWIMIGLGWLLATFFIAGLTGIIKTG